MNTPPFLIGATLLFWASQAGWLWLGALAAIVFEAPRFAKNRLQFAQSDLDRIWNLCCVLLFGAFVVAFVTSDGASALTNVANNNSFANRIDALNKGGRSVILVLLWLPLIFLPIAVAQAFSEQERMDWSTFSWWLRQQRGNGVPRPANVGLNVGWPYFALCLLATSAANQRTLTFPIGAVVLIVWAMWMRRLPGASVPRWVLSLVLVLGLAFTAQLGMREMQQLMQRLDGMLIAKFAGGRGFDPKEVRTALGSIGRLKLSGDIVMRVEAEGSPPPLLREASYKVFLSPSWAATRHGRPEQDFVEMNSESDLTTWKVLPDKPTRKQAIISGFLSGGQGLIAAPAGVAKIEDLPAIRFETNQLGVLRVPEGPGFFRSVVHFDEGRTLDGPPDDLDREVPNAEKPAIERIVASLGLRGIPAADVVKKVNEYFAREFRYTIWLEEPRRRREIETPLIRFLTRSKAGHCEYFATATVLLLRQAGVPARYAVGYSVQERKDDEWIIRERHAHAWCIAWINGAWRDVDTTPAGWAGIEAQRASSWEQWTDAWSDFWFKFSRWRWGKGEWKQYLIWLVVPLILIAGWRLLAQKQWNRSKGADALARKREPGPGLDSEFYRIEQALAEQGLVREADEPLGRWTRRVASTHVEDANQLSALLQVHYRLRFDPSGLSGAEREEFRTKVNDWLARQEERLAKAGRPNSADS